MTRFVGEPSTEGKAIGAGWGVRDLRRRPAPASSPAASFALSNNTNQPIPDEFATDLEFPDVDFVSANADFFTPDDISFYFPDGYWMVGCEVQWDTNGLTGGTPDGDRAVLSIFAQHSGISTFPQFTFMTSDHPLDYAQTTSGLIKVDGLGSALEDEASERLMKWIGLQDNATSTTVDITFAYMWATRVGLLD